MKYLLLLLIGMLIAFIAMLIAQEFGFTWALLFIILFLSEWSYLWCRSSKRLGR